MLIVIEVTVVLLFIHQYINFRSMKKMNDTERTLVNNLTTAFNDYSTKVGNAQLAATKRIEELLAGDTDSDDFVAAVNEQIATINSAATHLVDFNVPPATPEAPVPVIPPAATELPPAASTDAPAQ
jgi:hypothetical protein